MRIEYRDAIEVTERIRILLETEDTFSPFRMRVSFANGCLASIIRYKDTYGYDEGLFELAIVSPIGRLGEPEGYLDSLDVLLALAEIDLGKRTT